MSASEPVTAPQGLKSAGSGFKPTAEPFVPGRAGAMSPQMSPGAMSGPGLSGSSSGMAISAAPFVPSSGAHAWLRSRTRSARCWLQLFPNPLDNSEADAYEVLRRPRCGPERLACRRARPRTCRCSRQSRHAHRSPSNGSSLCARSATIIKQLAQCP